MKNSTIENFLMELGITPNRKGFCHLEELIILMRNNPTMKITNAYAIVAKAHNCNAFSIDTTVRNVIHSAYNNDKLFVLNKKMGIEVIDSYCPSNKVFIAYVIKYLELYFD